MSCLAEGHRAGSWFFRLSRPERFTSSTVRGPKTSKSSISMAYLYPIGATRRKGSVSQSSLKRHYQGFVPQGGRGPLQTSRCLAKCHSELDAALGPTFISPPPPEVPQESDRAAQGWQMLASAYAPAFSSSAAFSIFKETTDSSRWGERLELLPHVSLPSSPSFGAGAVISTP